MTSLNKPFKIVLPHFLTGLTENNNEQRQICFAKANHNNFIIQNNQIVRYQFELCAAEPQLFSNSKGYSYGAMQTSHCCFYCLLANKKELTADAMFCLARISERCMKPLEHIIHFVAVYFLKTCIDAVKEQYQKDSYVQPVWRKFKFMIRDQNGVSPYIQIIPEKCEKDYIFTLDPEAAMVHAQ